MNVLSRFLTALTFAVPAAVFARWTVARESPEIWRWVPLSAGIGAFLTTLIVWNVQQLQGAWSIDGQLLQLSSIHVDGHPIEASELLFFASVKSDQLHILACGEYVFHTNHAIEDAR